MAEGLSTAASVIAVAACAAESIKFLFRFFHEVPVVPENVRQLLSALKSLYTTLTALERCGARLGPEWHFTPHFCQRLTDCRTQLKVWSDKIARIENLLANREKVRYGWKGKTRRSWQKIRWLAAGERDSSRFIRIIQLYHADLSLELLTILLTLQQSVAERRTAGAQDQDLVSHAGSTENFPSPGAESQAYVLLREQSLNGQAVSNDSTAGPSHATVSQNQQGSFQRELLDEPPCTKFEGNPPNSFLHTEQEKCSLPKQIPRPNSDRPLVMQHKIRTHLVWRFNVILSHCMIRAGPATTHIQQRLQGMHLPRDSRHIGYGIGVSFSLPKPSSRRIYIELLIVFQSVLHGVGTNLLCSLDCVRAVPQGASIFESVRSGSIDCVRSLLASGQASVRDTTMQGLTLLHTASGLGQIDIVRLLVGAGADVNAADEDGETPLHRATSRKDNYDVVRLLIENGADLASVAVGNKTALHAIFNNTIGKILVLSNALEHIDPDSEGMSISHFLAWSRHTTPSDFERGRKHDTADLWSTDSYGRNCLHYAVLKGNVELLAHLLDRASPLELETRDTHGRTPLHCAARSSRAIRVMSLLLVRGVNIHSRDACGHDVLDHAAQWGKGEAVQQLLVPKPERNAFSARTIGKRSGGPACKFNSCNVSQSSEYSKVTEKGTRDAVIEPKLYTKVVGPRWHTLSEAWSGNIIWIMSLTLFQLLLSFTLWQLSRNL